MAIINKKARFDYILTEQFETGVVLSGGEVRSVREGRADLSRAAVRFLNGEVYLINAIIPVPGAYNYDPSRARKLLFHKSEIVSLETKTKQQKLNLVPLKLYNKGRLVKLQVALGKPKRKFEKREEIKKRDLERDLRDLS